MFKKLITTLSISTICAITISASVDYKKDQGYIDQKTYYNDIAENFVAPDIVKFILKNGFDYNERITDTENLRLDAEKIYVEGNKKAILIKVTNKTNRMIDVEKDVQEGTAYPKRLLPFATGWLVISNFELKKPYKYDTLSYNDKLTYELTKGNVTDIQKYFDSDIEIYKFSDGLNPVNVNKNEWIRDNINKSKLYVVRRVDRIIDEDSNRFGLFLSGFIKVTNQFYQPVSYYFIINKGKIVKIFEVPQIMKFKNFKKLIIEASK